MRRNSADPYAVEDSYAGLVWTADHAEELGIDPTRILLEGNSYGGGLAAGAALMARNRGGPSLIGQLLMYPSLDDRLATVSVEQYGDIEWDGGFNRIGWAALLGERQGTEMSRSTPRRREPRTCPASRPPSSAAGVPRPAATSA